MKIITVSGHCQDRCYFAVEGENGEVLYEQQEGYVPYSCGVGGGDDVELKIDIETGQIIGWNADRVKAGIQEYIEEMKDRRSRRRR
jgi:hypothetical protein